MVATADDDVPAAIRLVRDFVNSVEWQVDTDEWSSPSDLAAWLAAHTGVTPSALHGADLDLARRVREGLRTVLLLHAGHDALPTSVDDLNDALGRISLRMRIDAVGGIRLVSAAGPLAPILDAVDAARADGTWPRLKACSRDSCRWAYWDGSRNRSARWCTMAGCGNSLKMRRRNLGERAPDETIPESGGRPRVPTMLDVAARAGVSIKTVSNVVTGTVRVAPATRQRVEAAIAVLDYRPNLAARALRTGRGVGSVDGDGRAEPVR